MRLFVTRFATPGSVTTDANGFAPFTAPLGPVKNVPPAGGNAVFTCALMSGGVVVVSTKSLASELPTTVAGGAGELPASEKVVARAKWRFEPSLGAWKIRKRSLRSPLFICPMLQVTEL